MEMSTTIGKLAEALAAAQGEMRAAVKDAENPHFKSKFATLASCWDAVRGPLTKHGLTLVQLPSADGAKVTIDTVLAHSSGEWVKSTLTLVARDGSPQSVGSALTYGRRYGMSAVLGIATEDDDDGQAAQPRRDGDAQARAEAAFKAQEAKREAEEAAAINECVVLLGKARTLDDLDLIVPTLQTLSPAGKARLAPLYKAQRTKIRAAMGEPEAA